MENDTPIATGADSATTTSPPEAPQEAARHDTESAVSKAWDQLESGATAASGAAPDDATATGRDEKGRFAAGQKQPAAEKPSAAPATPGQQEAKPATPPAGERAPQSLPKAAAEKWATVPPEVREAYQRRDADAVKFSKRVRELEPSANYGANLAKALLPHAEMLRAEGYDVRDPEHAARAVQPLLSMYGTMRNGAPEQKAGVVAYLMKEFGIQPEHVNAALSGAVAQQAPAQPHGVSEAQIEALVQRQLDQQASAYRQRQAEEYAEAQWRELEQAGLPDYLDAVRPHALALITSGAASTLKDAIEQAAYANPATRARLLQEQQQAAQRAEAERKTAAAQQAKRAASSVTSSPAAPRVVPRGNKRVSTEDTVAAAWEELEGRVG